MSVVTLTMNPAIDIATGTERLVATDKMRCTPPRFDPGGGGVNAARTVAALDVPVTAVFPAGGPAGAQFEELVRDAGVAYRKVPVAGHTRENLAVTDEGTREQYRFVFPGPRLTNREQHRCLAAVEKLARNARYVIASGTLPPGVPADFYQWLADILSDLDVRLVLDTSGAPLRAMRGGVHLMKPSVRELSDYVGRPLIGRADQVAAARGLVDGGVSEIVLVSLGASGAFAVTRDTERWYAPIQVGVRSGIGAGDAMVGGTTVGLARGYRLDDAVRLGIAAATAALGTPGSQPGSRCRILDLYRELTAGAGVDEGPHDVLRSTRVRGD
ncbi:1-phosphofructokinase family hexose kinase [Nocardia otitidiscaviarum]|uniref:1-phosphofructokinase family hexose kinase n=1 Tax=Nocardia otitidiscaviarum TaxID=1823 RepID=UPI0006938D72|nr:1-phosphofructokinase family hexose kinase [Nocardia otitidiscaviarum]MBF6137367.1 1-phosphofructokinase family hexose kinase [Nocardia otitidiscaviarum]MBF6488371.1 1-phosphofructokinase family hexose kinase [Nocardia otitidiscaviarum]